MTKFPDNKPSRSSNPCLLRRDRLWLPLFTMLGMTLLSGTAGPQTGPVQFVGMDKVGHVVIFGLLSVAVARCFVTEGGTRPLFVGLVAFAVTAGFGGLDEWHQLHNPLRRFEWADLGADAVGAVLGATVYLRFPGIRHWLEKPLGSMRLLTGKLGAD
ncbi:MAG: hypothetical protein GVY10_11515 [Verrucomicrobia bacterium]|jgi:VanZ family protein|nr:hypothetical protein [Verrucomicrobiota bacterium]